jgi:hypothetical protein
LSLNNYFLNEYVGNLLINNKDVTIKKIGAIILLSILIKSKFVILITNGVKTKIPPAGDGHPQKNYLSKMVPDLN